MLHRRPEAHEHAPHHSHYIDLISSPVLDTLREQRGEIERMLPAVDAGLAGFRYAPGKWTVREVVGHMADAERVYTYRALAIARGDGAALPKYDPDGYVASADFDQRSMPSLVEELLTVREGTIRFFENLPHEAWSRTGLLGGSPLSVRALAFIAAGHLEQHLRVLHDRYGVAR
jgi:DinB superfamily